MPTLKRHRDETSDEGARKKLKAEQVDQTPTILPIMDLTTEETPAAPSQERQTLEILRNDFDDLRQLVTCKICERLLYEPYVISCGHTYCYSCLCQWFTTSKKKTCPNCREVITRPPAPSYVIKEMTNVFMRRHDLLPDGETIEQHEQWKFEEADIVRRDKSDDHPRTGGLFKGFFRPRRAKVLPIHDPDDHVDRCPECHHEVEDGRCENCGIYMDSWSDTDTDVSLSSMSNSLDVEDIPDDFEDEDHDASAVFGEFDIDFDPEAAQWMQEDQVRQLMAHGRHWRPGRLPNGARVEQNATGTRLIFGARDEEMGDNLDELSDEEDDDEDDETGSLDEFLDDRDINDITAHTISSQTAADNTPARHRSRHRRVIDSSDGAEAIATDSDSSRSDSDSDGVRHNPQFRRPRAPISLISDDEDEPVEGDSRQSINIGDEDEQSDDDEEERMVPRPRRQVIDDDDDSDDEPRVISSRYRGPAARRSGRPILARRQQRPIPIIDSDDESDDSSATEEMFTRTTDPISNNRNGMGRNGPRPTTAASLSSDSDSSEDEDIEPDDYSIDGHYANDMDDVVQGVQGADFSPMQSEDEDEGNQQAMNYFNVYGDGDDGSDVDDEDDDVY
ncbi:hypothetical protein E4T42_04326 [Aureobasidium subglaciale]|nr:hypothetical protein E4T42_04326 [Aureobasidium subglaciale]